MERLTRKEMKAVLDRAVELRTERKLKHGSKKQSRMIVLRRHGKDGLKLLLVATRRPERNEAKVVASWVAGSDTYDAREIDLKYIAGWCVDWNVKENDEILKNTGKHPYYNNGGYTSYHAWCSSDGDDVYKADFAKWNGPWYEDGGVINADAIQKSRYKYCGWAPGSGVRIVDAIQSYDRNPKTELLARLGHEAFYLLGTKGKMRDMERDHQLRHFVMTHIGDWRVMHLPWNEIKWLAASGKRTVEQAEARVAFKHEVRDFWKYYYPPKGVDRAEAYKYCKAKNVSRSEYAEAMRLAIDEGLDPSARCVYAPTDFAAFFAERKSTERAVCERKFANRDMKIAMYINELKKRLEGVKTGEYKILWLEKQADFLEEGDAMRNCIGGGSYSKRMSERQCVCLVLVSDDERVDVEIDGQWRVNQCHTVNNQRASDAAAKIAEKIAAALRKHYTQKAA